MSNPAIVLMTDPSRCNLGDVHHLVQALAEIQQMGEHAMPQAFCDHPESAREFIDAYAHAYPQLVLEDRAIPTPDHLQSLVSTGQIGAIGRPPELATSPDLQPPTEPTGAGAFPIVMLTLGSSQVLLDALQQSPAMRESIRLIDVGQEKTDPMSVSIADAVAIRGLDGEPWEQGRWRTERLELDDMPGPAKADFASLALHEDQLSIDVVETVESSSNERSAYDQDREPEPAPVAPAALAPTPAPAAVAAPVTLGSPDDVPAAATASATEPASAPAIPRSSESDPVATEAVNDPGAAVGEPEAQAPQEAEGEGRSPAAKGDANGNDKHADKADDLDKEGRKAAPEAGDEIDAVDAGKPAPEPDDDVHYPPVGTLLAGADVLYPALDQDGVHGALHELVSVLLDDGMFDPDQAADFMEAQGGSLPLPDRQEVMIAVRTSDNVVTLEEVYGASDQEGDDELAGADAARLPHDSDL